WQSKLVSIRMPLPRLIAPPLCFLCSLPVCVLLALFRKIALPGHFSVRFCGRFAIGSRLFGTSIVAVRYDWGAL
ncbi:MAG TPA: hypothetical protein VM715_12465, partial [Candidatus Acidoferrum sp.]|nr:hypothetical protein [Candidatus Acidoferrum sp.]